MAEIKEYQQMYTVRGNLKLRKFTYILHVYLEREGYSIAERAVARI